MNGVFNPTALLVEDDPNDVLLFQRAFSRIGKKAELLLARDAFRAERILQGDIPATARERQDGAPRLVLLDLKLPGKGGFELLAWIRDGARTRCLPVVIFSSSSEPEDIAKAYALGANSYIVKPAGFDALQETVRRICGYWLALNCIPEPEVK